MRQFIPRPWITAMLALAIACAGMPFLPAAKAAAAPPIYTNAQATSLIDVESGRILYSEDGDKPMLIASLTKIMTAIVAIEHGKLTDKVKTSKRAAGKEGSSIYLKLGEEMTLEEMLYGLMLRSGNDAATAIAEHVGGSEEGFVYLMNEKAKMIGLMNSQFMNPSGLDQKGHYSTANDLAKLTAYAMHNPVFKEIVKTKGKLASGRDYKWMNKNKMLNMYEGADGVKTGYTKAALRCLVSSATRDTQQLAAVTLSDRSDWVDHSRLLDWGFANFPLDEVVRKGQPIAGQPLAAGRTFRYPFGKGERAQLTNKLVLVSPMTMDYTLGERGRIEWYLGAKKIAETPVYDPDGPRIDLPEKPAWSSADRTARLNEPWTYVFASSLKQVLKVLFGGKEAI
ncbi:serine hydrolase [Paenibacillus methanolicus]|uniref:D-alanyl-D-alanine carboxypeptidase n=1 Tax=Paenibacillus methanolicus TaxID=582686 RepID=A0A5S5CHI9_9BACL|nr:D-alanyl-D-alanine carboxypeptidase [Paenibacillus methanolicus]